MKRSKIIGFAVGPVGAAVLGAVSLPVSTWMFGAADIGRIAMLQTVTSLAIILFGLGLDQSYLREFHHAKDGKGLFHLVIAPGLALLGTASLAVLLVAPGWLANSIFGANNAVLAYIVVLTLLSAFCSRYFSLILRMEERGLAFSMSQLLPKLIFLVVLLIVYLAGPQRAFVQLLSAHVFGVVAATLIFAWNTRRTWAPLGQARRGNDFDLASLLRYGSPLMVAGLAFWGLEALDKVSLRFLSSFVELGNYSVAVGIASVAGTLSVLFTTIWIPTAYRWAAEADCASRIEAVAHKLVAMGSALICLAGAATWTLQFLLPPAYSAVQYLVCVCMAPPVLYAAAEVTGIGAGIVRKSLPVMLSAMLACAINGAGNLLLIPLLGARGAAISTALAFFALFVLRTEISIRQWATLRRAKLYLPMAGVTLLAILFALSGQRFPKVWMALWNVCFITFLVVYRTTFTELLVGLNIAKKKGTTAVPVISDVCGEID